MNKWTMEMPTYYGARMAAGIQEQDEYGAPNVPVLVARECGLRIVLGTHDQEDCDKPDLLIERRPNGWAIFIHPDAGDPCALIYILDDARSFCVTERGSLNPLQIVDDRPLEVDGLEERGVG